MEVKEMTTQEAIMEQMLENTGRSICDSGDHYGRAWQRNQGKTWEQLTANPVTLEAHVYTYQGNRTLELLGCIKLAPWLEDNLEYSPELQAQYEAWVEANDPDNDQYDLERMENFAEKVNDGSHWAGFDYPRTINSYNGDCDLSQTIQFVEFAIDDEPHVLLQVHGGCDVRGGYSSPKAYKVIRDYFGNWLVDAYGCESLQWDESLDECSGHAGCDNLKDYPVFEFEYESKLEQNLEDLAQTDMNTESVRSNMKLQDELNTSAAFEEFCNQQRDTYPEGFVVVFNRKAYFVLDDGPEEIWADCNGLHN